MSPIPLTPAQHAILAYAVHHTDGKIEWFPEHIKGGARQKVLDGMFKRALITPDGEGWRVAAEGYDALGMPRPSVNKTGIGQFEANLDQIIANAEGASAAASDPELEAAVNAAEATWAKPRTRDNSKQAEVIRMLQRPEGATISQICTATGWQAHTVRGTFAGAFKKKLGLTIVSDKPQGGERVYRIA
ncbi:hypothetical protein AD428_00475 [Achromobacter sp. DMS1]|uniref:DUF3489 domain-containing protein n=1 Tax=Achromobacter sp. DMS1 TaxID=1688405 RepID=UPI00069E4541|nr:DUF3489 domain-containing protein [Achromobacter sp. DMS1]KOF54989.1 hypothetical protein AD428_03690 [Achromobacter sp. DMS1]KOF55472.1 hypothetical protein AD428_00475 [Achromobacter sp. DMS1]